MILLWNVVQITKVPTLNEVWILNTIHLKGIISDYFAVFFSHTIYSIFFSFCACAMFLAPTLGLVRAQETPQQISSGFSCGPDIKGARREEGKQQRSRHWHQYARGESRTMNKAEQELWRMKRHRNRRAVETERQLNITKKHWDRIQRESVNSHRYWDHTTVMVEPHLIS